MRTEYIITVHRNGSTQDFYRVGTPFEDTANFLFDFYAKSHKIVAIYHDGKLIRETHYKIN